MFVDFSDQNKLLQDEWRLQNERNSSVLMRLMMMVTTYTALDKNTLFTFAEKILIVPTISSYTQCKHNQLSNFQKQ